MSSSCIFPFLIICLFVFTCSNIDNEKKNDKYRYAVTTKSYNAKSSPCPDSLGSCAEINLEVPFIENHKHAASINREILNELENMLENFPPALASFDGINLKLDSFVSQHKNFSEEVNFPQNWTLKIHFKVLENNLNSFSILLHSDRFTGGAHPINAIKILSFNPGNGKRRFITDIIKNESKLKELIVKEVKRKRNLSDEIDLTSEGFYANEWPLPENVALLSQGFYLVYNAYEIGPYVLGSTELLIPLDEIKPLLKD
ncbi:MAG: DUF3298 domain-containing protein [Bacteroidota bacterium]